MLLLEEDLLTSLSLTSSGRQRMVDLTHSLLIFLIISVFFLFKVQKGINHSIQSSMRLFYINRFCFTAESCCKNCVLTIGLQTKISHSQRIVQLMLAAMSVELCASHLSEKWASIFFFSCVHVHLDEQFCLDLNGTLFRMGIACTNIVSCCSL